MVDELLYLVDVTTSRNIWAVETGLDGLLLLKRHKFGDLERWGGFGRS